MEDPFPVYVGFYLVIQIIVRRAGCLFYGSFQGPFCLCVLDPGPQAEERIPGQQERPVGGLVPVERGMEAFREGDQAI